MIRQLRDSARRQQRAARWRRLTA